MSCDTGGSQESKLDNVTSSYQERWDAVLRQRKHRGRQQRQEQTRRNHDQFSKPGAGTDGIDGLFARGDQAIRDWSAKAADYSHFRVHEHHTDADAVQVLLSALNQMKQERDNAIALISLLTSERTRLRTHIGNQNPPETPTQRLYRKVGLHEGCPDFLLQAAQAAYRKTLHPDRQPELYREEAERRFMQAEEVFAEIKRLRSG